MSAQNTCILQKSRKQNTLKNDISYSGIGVHTGKVVSIRLCPAAESTGIIFKRIDVSGTPEIPARLEYVCDTLRSTTIGINDLRIHTIEHLMAALKAYHIDNLIIEIDSIEPPVGNGSSDVFVEMIEKAGIAEQQAVTPVIKIQQPIYHSEGDIHLVALPHEGYKISYTLNYPDEPALRSQFQSLQITSHSFKSEIAPCRTFSLYKEIAYLMDRGLIKGASLSNGVAIDGDVVYSKGGLFFRDEPVRHKILDMIGDLGLIGFDFEAHVLAIRSGHATNYALAKKIYDSLAGRVLNES